MLKAMDLKVDKWLCDLGLDQYVSAFEKNDVDGRVLHLMTNEELKELGVSLGHRKLRLAAIGDASSGATTDAHSNNEQQNETGDLQPFLAAETPA
mgnify:CR=1 FL=1